MARCNIMVCVSHAEQKHKEIVQSIKYATENHLRHAIQMILCIMPLKISLCRRVPVEEESALGSSERDNAMTLTCVNTNYRMKI